MRCLDRRGDDENLGVASQGGTRNEALENLDEAVALQAGEAGESIDTWEKERAVFDDLDVDLDDVREAREGVSSACAGSYRRVTRAIDGSAGQKRGELPDQTNRARTMTEHQRSSVTGCFIRTTGL